MASHVGRVGNNVLVGVGAAFNLASGAKRQAPRWMQKSALEWLFRLMQEPRRLGPRYLIGNPLFMLLMTRQLLAGGKGREPGRPPRNHWRVEVTEHGMLDTKSPIYVAGHQGLVGSALARRRCEGSTTSSPRRESWTCAIKPPSTPGSRAPARLRVPRRGHRRRHPRQPTRPAEFLYDNLMIHATVLHAAYRTGVTKLLYLGSSCIYPRDCPQPIREEYLLTGPLEKTNEAYAIAKIAGLKSCEAYRRQYGCNFISAMPTNLYGPNDNFDLTSSHVLPALIRKFHEAAQAAATARSSSGAPARRGASSCTSTTWPTRACS